MLQQGQQTELTLNLVKYFDVQTAQILISETVK